MGTILVTGGAGAIGSYLVKELCKTDQKIIVIDDLSSGYLENLPQYKHLEFINASILDNNALDYIFNQNIEVVYHLAANFANQNSVDFPEKDLLTNGLGTLRLLEFSNKWCIKRFIYSSSSCIYGNRQERLSENLKEYSLDTPYGITKLLGERYVIYFHQHHGLPTVIVRYFNTFGPGEYPGKYRNVVPNFFYKAIHKQPLVITGDGNETRDFNYIANTVDGTLLAAKSERAIGNTYNLASGKTTRIIDLANQINKMTGNPAPIEFSRRRSWDSIKSRCAETTLAERDFDYRLIIDLEEGLKKTFQWLKHQNLEKCRF